MTLSARIQAIIIILFLTGSESQNDAAAAKSEKHAGMRIFGGHFGTHPLFVWLSGCKIAAKCISSVKLSRQARLRQSIVEMICNLLATLLNKAFVTGCMHTNFFLLAAWYL